MNLKEAQCGDDQIKVILFPKNQQNEYDIIRLELETIEKEKRIIDMTPDEAVEIISNLSTMLVFYLNENDKYSSLKKKLRNKRIK
jgi:hypothetical protein